MAMNPDYELVVIGGGPAGIGAAAAAYDAGLRRILIVERDLEAGGILNQCIHNGFGLHIFKEELTGPEYAGRIIDEIRERGIACLFDTMVLSLEDLGGVKRIGLMSMTEGYRHVTAATVVLAMGCRERTRGAIQTPGTRPSGILTAGTAQRYVNMEGYQVGRRVIILGSGDIGLIMARRMTLEGARVLACVEIMPYPGGLSRNIVQCLEDFGIPLLLSHTISRIEGRRRVEAVTVQKVGEDRKLIPGTEELFEVDTVLLSVGLIPENELSRAAGIKMDPLTGGPYVFENLETSIPGIFACGNVLHVHDLVDHVTKESRRAGRAAADKVLEKKVNDDRPVISLLPGPGMGYALPQKIRKEDFEDSIRVFFRVREPRMTPGRILVRDGEKVILSARRPYMLPGEMDYVDLKPEILSTVTGDHLTLAVES